MKRENVMITVYPIPDILGKRHWTATVSQLNGPDEDYFDVDLYETEWFPTEAEARADAERWLTNKLESNPWTV